MTRWSRERAREQWQTLQPFVGYPLGIGLAVVGLWPALALLSAWELYAQPGLALAAYLASLALVGGLWWRGRSGLSLRVSLGAGVVLVVLDLTVILQVAPGEPVGAAMWMGSWGAAVPMVLAFGRPIEEPIGIFVAMAATNLAIVVRGEQTIESLHAAPLHVLMPLASATAGLVFVAALRRSVVNARRSRARTEALTQHRRIVEAVDGERATRVTGWEDRIAPLLEDIAAGVRSVQDPDIGARCRRLAAALRSSLRDDGGSILHALLPTDTGAEVNVHDQDVGHRLMEADRVALLTLVRALCRGAAGGSLRITLLPDSEPDGALVVLAADGLPVPVERAGATLVAETPTLWWLDMTLRCQDAPALAARRFLDAVPGA